MGVNDKFYKIIEFTLANEGGYVNDPDDEGGETNFGLTKRSFPGLDIKNITRDGAIAIYKRVFWDPFPFDKIHDFNLCRKFFDMSVNMGYSQAAKLLQDAVGTIAVDGNIGPISLQAINKSDPVALLRAYIHKILSFYEGLVDKKPSRRKFLKGWTRRAYL